MVCETVIEKVEYQKELIHIMKLEPANWPTAKDQSAKL